MTKLILAFRNFANAPDSRDSKINILQITVFWILTKCYIKCAPTFRMKRAASIFMVTDPESGGSRTECEDDMCQSHSNVARKVTSKSYDRNTCHLPIQYIYIYIILPPLNHFSSYLFLIKSP